MRGWFGRDYALFPDEPEAAQVHARGGRSDAEPAGRKLGLMLLSGHEGAVNACAVFPDGLRVLTAGEDGFGKIWDSASGGLLLTLSGHEGEIRSCAVFPNGQHALTAGEDGTARIWDTTGGEALAVFSGHDGPVFSCAVFPDGERALTLGRDRTARIWNVATCETLVSFEGPEDPRDRQIMCDYTRKVGQHVPTPIPGAGDHCCAVSSDGTKAIVIGGDDGEFAAAVQDAGTGAMLAEIEGRCCFGCAVTPNDKRVVIVCENWTKHEVQVLDSVTGEVICVKEIPEGYINCCAFSPIGDLLVTGTDTGTMTVWSCSDDGRLAEVVSFDGASGQQVRSCAIFPDGERLLVACKDGCSRIWKMPEELKAQSI
mmetsp:Transcript_113515/g.321188  ORF Transcript_113515/g.321188 Transcript_113515/m.321188 type:complete len:370 (-) Transcript_113515:191-1300(-)